MTFYTSSMIFPHVSTAHDSLEVVIGYYTTHDAQHKSGPFRIISCSSTLLSMEFGDGMLITVYGDSPGAVREEFRLITNASMISNS